MRFHTLPAVLGFLVPLVTHTPTMPLSKQAFLATPQDSIASREKVWGNNWYYLCSDQPTHRFFIERLDIFPNPPQVDEYTTLRLWGGPGSSSSFGPSPSISYEQSDLPKPMVLPLCKTYGMDVWQFKRDQAPELPGGIFGKSCPPIDDWVEITYHFLVWDRLYDEGNYTNQIKILDSEGDSMVCFEGTIDWRK